MESGGRADDRRTCFQTPNMIKFSKTQISESPSVVNVVVDDDDMLFEILVRVPVKSLFTFKCVSKRWLFMISQPSFARSYVSRRIDSASSHFPPWTFLYQFTQGRGFSDNTPDREKFHHVSSNDFKSPGFSVLLPPLAVSNDRVLITLASSNGLLLCRLDGYYVCNPVIQQWVAIPVPPRRLKSVIEGFITQTEAGVVARYKVVRMERLCDDTDVLNMEVFSSETGEWSGFKVYCPHPVQLLDYRPFLYNGVLYWYDHGFRIVGYDPYSNMDRCRLIKLPRDRDLRICDKYSGINRFCEVCRGNLQYFEVAQDGQDLSLSVWRLTDYDAGEWCLEHRITCSEILADDAYLTSLPGVAFPVACHPFDMDIVYLWCAKGIVSCNVRTRKFEALCHPICRKMMLCWPLVYPFVLLWPTPVPLPSWKSTLSS